MTLEQLTLLVKFLRGDINSLSVQSAKLVLVDGLSQADAARKLSTDTKTVKTNTVNNGVKRYREAHEEIKRATRLNPFCPDIIFEDEGVINFWLGKYDDALESFSKLKSPTNKSLFYSAATQSKLNNLDKAKECFTQAVAQSGQTLDQFMESQKYKKQEQVDDLRSSLAKL